MTDVKDATVAKVGLYNNPNLSEEIIKAAAQRDINILHEEGEIQKVIRAEKRSDDKVERERKESEEKSARERADTVWKEMRAESKCCLRSPFICKKIVLLLLVVLEIVALWCWVHNPTDADFEKLIAPILFVGILFTLIILLGNTIVKDERELAKAKAEMLKEAFMRKLK